MGQRTQEEQTQSKVDGGVGGGLNELMTERIADKRRRSNETEKKKRDTRGIGYHGPRLEMGRKTPMAQVRGYHCVNADGWRKKCGLRNEEEEEGNMGKG